jgi:hypothetical protein
VLLSPATPFIMPSRRQQLRPLFCTSGRSSTSYSSPICRTPSYWTGSGTSPRSWSGEKGSMGIRPHAIPKRWASSGLTDHVRDPWLPSLTARPYRDRRSRRRCSSGSAGPPSTGATSGRSRRRRGRGNRAVAGYAAPAITSSRRGTQRHTTLGRAAPGRPRSSSDRSRASLTLPEWLSVTFAHVERKEAVLSPPSRTENPRGARSMADDMRELGRPKSRAR